MFRVGFRSYVNEKDMKLAKKLGIEVVELMQEDVTRARLDEVHSLFKEYDIKPSAALVFPQRGMDELKADVDYFSKIGCPAYVGHLKPLSFKSPCEDVKAFKLFWSEACTYAADKGVKVAIQSCGLNPESWDIMFNEVPELYLEYDPSFTNQQGMDIPTEILRYGSRFIHMHAKDEIPIKADNSNVYTDFKYAPAGMGSINWGQIIALLYEIGYKGDIAIEVHSKYWFSDEAYERGIALAKRHLESFMY